MHLLTALALLPAALAYCPTDFAQNATMAEGPCRGIQALIPNVRKPASLARISFSNGTTLVTDFRLWDDKAYTLEVAPPTTLRTAVGVASKMDLGFYAPVSGVKGTCLNERTL